MDKANHLHTAYNWLQNVVIKYFIKKPLEWHCGRLDLDKVCQRNIGNILNCCYWLYTPK